MIIAASSNARKIPTFLGLAGVLALVVVVAVTARGASQVTKFFPRANSPSAPSSVGVANVTDTGATVYWVTDRQTAGSVFYGKTPNLGDGVAVDDRDLSSANNLYSTHFVRLNSLKATTKYYFKIGVGQDTFGDPAKSKQPYEITTGTALSTAPVVDPIFGKITDQSGGPLSGAIVVWDVSGSGKIAALSKSDGNYVLPIGNARTVDLDNYLSLTDGLPETVIVDSGGGSPPATINCKIGQDRPLPAVKLGETIDCSQKTTLGTGASGFTPPKSTLVASPSAGTVTLDLSNGQTFSTPLPTFSGKAGPNQVVKIVINSEVPYSGTVQADPSGNWSWTPPANLTPGQHTVIITVVNPDGTTQTITRTFTVASGTSILPITSGTPSATLTHLTCVGTTCSTVSGAGPNTCATDGDCVATPSPTPAPRPLPPPPQTGSTENTVILLTLGLIFATLGTVMIFHQNGSR